MESKRDNGLIVGHAYTIIRCYEVSVNKNTMYIHFQYISNTMYVLR